jgi:nucleoside-diphosphate-sugar epimerase
VSVALPRGSRLLLTGATGFLGRHILERAKDCGAEVFATCRNPPAKSGGVRWIAADLLHPEACHGLIAEARPTHLIHSAWIATPGVFWASPANADWLTAGIALLKAFGDYGGQRFVGVGTCAEYDWSGEVFAEDRTPALPTTPYGKAKAAMASATDAFAARYGFSFAWGRVFLPYGPGDAPERLVPTLLRGLLKGEDIKLSEGTQVRDFLYAPDGADLIVRLAASAELGVFNVGTGVGSSVRAVAERLAQAVGRSDLLRFGALPARAGEPDTLVADMEKVARLVRWKPLHSLDQGLEATVAAFRT